VQTFFFDAGAHISREKGGDHQHYDLMGGNTDWLVNWYGPNVTFDHVYAWALPTTPANFDTVDPRLVPRLHYYPHGVSEKDGDAFNVLTVIKERCRPEDFVVFKLDIDTPIEEIIAEKAMSDPEIIALVDEFYWEKHIRNPVMKKHKLGGYGEPGKTDLAAWYDTVIPARKRGFRMHSWP
jgi:hypothetical protein